MSNACGKAMVLHHSLRIEVFHSYYLVLANKSGGGFMYEVFSLIGNFTIKVAHTFASFEPSLGIFLPPRYNSVCSLQSAFQSSVTFKMERSAVGGSDRSLYSKVDTYGFMNRSR